MPFLKLHAFRNHAPSADELTQPLYLDPNAVNAVSAYPDTFYVCSLAASTTLYQGPATVIDTNYNRYYVRETPEQIVTLMHCLYFDTYGDYNLSGWLAWEDYQAILSDRQQGAP